MKRHIIETLKIYLLFSIVFIITILMSCSEDDSLTGSGDTDTGGGGNHDPNFLHLALNVTCHFSDSEPDRGLVATVMVFDQLTGKRVISGGSLATGYFCTITKLDSRKSYRIEFYSLPNSDCVMYVFNVSYQNNPWLWVKNFGEPTTSNFNVGGCSNQPPISGCWGSGTDRQHRRQFNPYQA